MAFLRGRRAAIAAGFSRSWRSGTDRSGSQSAAVLLGATLGFLRYNWNPATIFMGDSSLLLGFCSRCSPSSSGSWSRSAANLADSDPRPGGADLRHDTSASRVFGVVFPSRRWTRSSSHRLVRLGMSVRQAVATVYLVAFLCGSAAVAALLLPSRLCLYPCDRADRAHRAHLPRERRSL